MRSLIIALATLAVASTAAAQTNTVSIAPGDSVALQVSGDGFDVAQSHGATSLSESERAITGNNRENPAAMGENVLVITSEELDASEPIEPDRIKIRLLMMAPHDSVLVIDNGYDRALSYRAHILVNDQGGPTDVCWVLPNHHGYEHWPYLIDHIELTELSLETWKDGDPVPCR